MAKFVNLTGLSLNLPNGVILPSDGQAKVRDTFGEFDADGVCPVAYGDIVGLPDPVAGTLYVVSGLVLAAAQEKGRTDVVAPASGHPRAVKNEKGHILEVPGFVRR